MNKEPTSRTTATTTPTQVRHPSPAVRRRIAVVALAAGVLVPTTFLATRIAAKDTVAPNVAHSEAPDDVRVMGDVAQQVQPTVVPPATQSIGVCGLICDPDLASVWQRVAGMSEPDARRAALVEAVDSALRAVDDAVVAAAPALR